MNFNDQLRRLTVTPGASPFMVLNPNASAETLDVLAQSPNPTTRASVALHANSSPETLRNLASDSAEHVRASVALNAITSQEMLCFLAFDKDARPRRALTHNPSTPSRVVAALIADRQAGWEATLWDGWRTVEADEIPQGTAVTSHLRASNIHTPPADLARLSHSKDPHTVFAVASNPSTGQRVLARLAGSDDMTVRSNVAGNRAAPVHVLAELMTDPDDVVRWSAVRNPACTAEMIEIFARDPSEDIRNYVAGSPLLTRRTAVGMLTGAGDWQPHPGALRWPGWTDSELDGFAHDDKMFHRNDWRWIVAQHPNTAPRTLRNLADIGSDNQCLESVAANPNTPRDVLETLATERLPLSVNFLILSNPALAGDLADALASSPAVSGGVMSL